MPGIKGEARRAAPDRPLGRALLQRWCVELRWDGLTHKAPRTGVAAPTRRSGVALCCGQSEGGFEPEVTDAAFGPDGGKVQQLEARL